MQSGGGKGLPRREGRGTHSRMLPLRAAMRQAAATNTRLAPAHFLRPLSLDMQITCPSCGASIAGVPNGTSRKPYCPHCGWNIPAAASAERAQITTLWFISAIGTIAAVGAWTHGPYGVRGALLIAGVFVGIPMLFRRRARLRLNTMRQLQPLSAAAASALLSHQSNDTHPAAWLNWRPLDRARVQPAP